MSRLKAVSKMNLVYFMAVHMPAYLGVYGAKALYVK